MSGNKPVPRTMEEILRDTRRRLLLVERRLSVRGGLPARLGPHGAQVTDWNLATETGFYWATAAAANAPAAAISVGIVEADNAGNVIQTVHRSASGVASSIGPGWRRRRASNGAWSAWQAENASDGLPDVQQANAPSANSITAGAASWWNLGGLGAQTSINPPRPLIVDAQVSAICKASTGYTMIGLNVNGGVSVTVDQDPDGTERGAFWTPFTSSSVDTGLISPVKRIRIPGGVATNFMLYTRRSVGSGTQTCNYPLVTVKPVRWD